jgi:hypothetical protein
MLHVKICVPDKTIHCIPDNSQFIEVVKKSKSAFFIQKQILNYKQKMVAVVY